MEDIAEGDTKEISENNIITSIAINRGTLRITGNQCKITVSYNLGTIIYSGNDGYLKINPSKDIKNSEKVKGKIIATCNNLEMIIGNDCYNQVLKFHGTGGVLRLKKSVHLLSGKFGMKIKEGRLKNLRVKSSVPKPTVVMPDLVPKPSVVMPDLDLVPKMEPSRCSLVLTGCRGVNIKFGL